MPVASAAAVLAVALSGLVVGAHGARPGDPLWAVSKVLYQERAASVEAAVDVEVKLQKAKQAMVEGRTDEARKELEAADSGLGGVRAEEGKEVLAGQQEDLSAKLKDAQPGQPVNDPTTSSSSTSPSSSKPQPSSSSRVPSTPTPTPSPAPLSSDGTLTTR